MIDFSGHGVVHSLGAAADSLKDFVTRLAALQVCASCIVDCRFCFVS